MKKIQIIFMSICLAGIFHSYGQSYMTIGDNIDIASNSWIIFNPGTYNIPDPDNDGLIRINNKQNIVKH